jgi:hypothetical protein
MTATKRAKEGGLFVTEMANIKGVTRKTLHLWFKTDLEKFDETMYECMSLKVERKIKELKEARK